MKPDKKPLMLILTIPLAFFAIVAAMAYLVIRAVLVYWASYKGADWMLAVLLIAAEIFILLHGIGYIINIIRTDWRLKLIVKQTERKVLDREALPPVAILVPARHEPREVLEQTFVTINNIDYANKKIYLLDDSVDEKYKREAEEIAREYGLNLFRRTKPWHGAKAGIVNDCLEQLTEKYVAVFDADQNPMPDFLTVLIPLMEADEKLAFVQTPQFYSNIQKNRVARGAVLQQAVFYEYICEGKGAADSMFCCGTNVVFRLTALKDVHGMDESTVTEDFATSLKFHLKGYRSLYFRQVCAFGMGPEDLVGYFKQQFRWAVGTIGVFKKVLFQFLRRPFSLSPAQWLEYFLSSTYYFVGCAFFVLMLCPVAFIFFRVPSFFAKPEVYLLSFLPYLILSTGVFYYALRQRRYKPGDLILGQLLGAITFPVYMKAAVAGILGLKVSFGITPKLRGGAVSYLLLWPQLAIMATSFVALVWAGNRFVYEHEPALLVNGFWAFYHFLIFWSIFFFNTGTRSAP